LNRADSAIFVILEALYGLFAKARGLEDKEGEIELLDIGRDDGVAALRAARAYGVPVRHGAAAALDRRRGAFLSNRHRRIIRPLGHPRGGAASKLWPRVRMK